MEAESVSAILCTSKQTRFNIGTPNYRELDIEGLNITVKSAASSKSGHATGTSSKRVGKGKARSEGTEILDNATLRLKAGQRYALVGRNGSGKSTLLKAISQKLIPGIPEETRVVILQQTDAGDIDIDAGPGKTSSHPTNDRSVLEEVIERATARHEAQRELDGKAVAFTFLFSFLFFPKRLAPAQQYYLIGMHG
jgi:polynucleotide 5'-kinase involved in rRNA processing